MIFQLLTLLFYGAMIAPVVFIFTQRSRFHQSPRFLVFAIAYSIFVITELAFFAYSVHYRQPASALSTFVHAVIDSILIFSGTMFLVFEPPTRENPETRWGPFYAQVFQGAGLLVLIVFYVGMPAQALSLVTLLVMFTTVTTVIFLVRNLDDEAIPFLRIIVLWALRHIMIYFNSERATLVFGVLFVSALVWEINKVVISFNNKIVQENALLIKARDTVVTMLNDISSSVKNISSIEYTLVRVLETIIDSLSVEGAAIYAVEQRADGSQRLRFSQSSGIFWTMDMGEAQSLTRTTIDREHLRKALFMPGEGVVGLVAQTQDYVTLDRSHDTPRMKQLGLNPRNIRNILAVPLKVKDQLLGVLVVQNRKNVSSFGEDDMQLLSALTDQASISINNVRMYTELARTDRLRQEMSIATNIQKSLLPKTVPTSETLRISPFFHPAKEVGGDYYDFIESSEGNHSIVIGDVSGKGLPAGMIMIIARTALQIVARGQTDVHSVVVRFSQEMYSRMRRGQFMTLNFLRWEEDTRTLHFAGAGHEHILWFRKENNEVERIRAGGIAVGLVDDPSALIKKQELVTKPGDVLLLYTDGVTEARDHNEVMFGLNRLSDSLKNHAACEDPDSIRDNVMEDVFEFMGETEQYDDITMLILSVR